MASASVVAKKHGITAKHTRKRKFVVPGQPRNKQKKDAIKHYSNPSMYAYVKLPVGLGAGSSIAWGVDWLPGWLIGVSGLGVCSDAGSVAGWLIGVFGSGFGLDAGLVAGWLIGLGDGSGAGSNIGWV